MKNPRKAILLLVLVSLLGSVGTAPWCASCGPKRMNCCKSSPSRAESIDRPACCEFRMVLAMEPHPGCLSPVDTGFQKARTPCVMSAIAAGERIPADPRLTGPGSFGDAGKESSPPIFLLNTSFLC